MLTDAANIAQYMMQPSPQQIAQIQFRMQIVDAWQIPSSAKVLEVGCGQGDMTAVLAHTVGDAGHITAVDIASPNYGAPLTLKQSTDYISATPLGKRITFYFQYDLLNQTQSAALSSDRTFSHSVFDYAVLAHCSWYFASEDQIRKTFQYLRPLAERLCYSEWDMEPRSFDQTAHLLAVLLQGQIETYKTESVRNIRTPVSRERLKQIMEEAGWAVETETTLDTALLHDAQWEILESATSIEQEAGELFLPAKTRDFLRSQIEVLRALATKGGNVSLPSYAILAK